MSHNFNNKPQQQRKIPDNRADPMSNDRTRERYAQKLFRDMTRREFNPFVNDNPFSKPEFLQSAIKVSMDTIREQSIIKYSLEVAYQGVQDPTVIKVYNDCIQKINAYSFIINILQSIQHTGDLNLLQNLVNTLPSYRYFL